MAYRFSIVMPAYNAERYIREAIESVVRQNFKDWQLVVIDDCSTDSTRSIVEGYISPASEPTRESKIQLLSTPQNSGGAFRPRLIGIEAADGEYIVEFDADDILEADYLEILNEAIRREKTDVALGRIVALSSGLSLIDDSDFRPKVMTGPEALEAYTDGYRISGMGAVKRVLYFEAMEHYGIPVSGMCSDEILTKMIFARAEAVAVTDARYRYRENDQSVTKKISLKQFDRIEGAYETLRLSNLVGSAPIWKRASAEFFHTFLSLSRLYLSFPFESEEDRNDVRQRLRNMFDSLRAARFRFVIPALHRFALSTGFNTYLKLLRLDESKRR